MGASRSQHGVLFDGDLQKVSDGNAEQNMIPWSNLTKDFRYQFETDKGLVRKGVDT